MTLISIKTDAFLSQARTESEINHPASSLALGVLLHLRGMVVYHMSFTPWYFTRFIFHLFNEVGWGRCVEGGKYESFFFCFVFVFFFFLFEAHKAQTVGKLRGAFLVTTNWVTCHRCCQDIASQLKCKAVSVASKTS